MLGNGGKRAVGGSTQSDLKGGIICGSWQRGKKTLWRISSPQEEGGSEREQESFTGPQSEEGNAAAI